MYTTPKFLLRRGNLYAGIFEAGNGGAWNDWYLLLKRTDNDEAANEWFKNIKISRRWKVPAKGWFSDIAEKLYHIAGVKKEVFFPWTAGRDTLIGVESEWLSTGGWEVAFSCDRNGTRGCMLEYNTGTRNNPEYEETFFKLHPKWSIYMSHGAGRVSKEQVYIEKIDGWDLVLDNTTKWEKIEKEQGD